MSSLSSLQSCSENDHYSPPPTIRFHVTVIHRAKPDNTVQVEEVKEFKEEDEKEEEKEEEEDSAYR